MQRQNISENLTWSPKVGYGLPIQQCVRDILQEIITKCQEDWVSQEITSGRSSNLYANTLYNQPVDS